MFARTLRIIARILLSLLAIILLIWLLLQTETVQNFIVGKVTARLSKNLNTQVRINHVSFSFFDKMNLEGTLIRDKQKDTLLYAGALKLRVTDWFFLKDKIELTYIGLENATIKEQRKDSVWNYQFLVDYFSSPSVATKPKDTASKGIQLNLKKLDFKNVTFLQNDLWQGQRMVVKTGSLLLDANNVDFNNNIYNINEIELDKPFFAVQNFNGLNPDTISSPKKSVDTGLYFNAAGLTVHVDSIKITSGVFAQDLLDSNKLQPNVFNNSHILFSQINGSILKLNFIKDTIKANINLSAKERSGFEVKKIKANFKLTPQIMEFSKLNIQTNESNIGDYYAMKFEDFNHDMNFYVEKVTMDARFKNSTISSNDIAYFAAQLQTWKKQIDINGDFFGTVNNFRANNIFLRAGNDSYISGSLIMKGLPDIDKTFINFTNGNLQTTYADVVSIFPSLKKITSPNLFSLGKLRFNGTFNGMINNFSSNGNISTAIGGMYANVTMKFPRNAQPIYNGTIITKQFNLGKFINASAIGLVSFKGKINGSGFDINKLETSVDGSFDQFQFNNYTYQNLAFNGTIKNKYFTGDFKASDSNFDFTSNIEVDLNPEEPKFNVLGDLAKADFKALKLSNEKFILAGLFDLNFQGDNIDEFVGSAKILNASLLHDSTRLDFDSLSINSSFDSANQKILRVQSNEFDVTINGQYNILDLPNSFQSFLSHYYPSYINLPKSTPKNQAFIVTIKTRDFEKYAQLINAKLSGLNDAEIIGGINTKDSGSFFLQTNIPYVKFDRYKLDKAIINGKGDFVSLNLNGNIDKIYLGDSTYFPNTKFSIQSQNDHSVLHLSTSANNTLNDAELNADIFTLRDGVRINFEPSSFVINDKKWDLEKQGEIVIRKHFASAQNVKFTQGFQEITVESVNEKDSTSNLTVRLKNVNMGDFTPMITKEPTLEGLVNGDVLLRDFYGAFKMEANLKTEQFRLNGDSVGVVRIKSLYDYTTGKINYEAQSDNEKYRFSAKGIYNIKDSTGSPLSTTFNLNGTKIGIVNEFLTGIFSDIDGIAYGNLTVKGNPNSPDLLGTVEVKNAGLTVDYTKVHYIIDSAIFNFQDGVMDFGTFQIKDPLNNTAIVRGKLFEQHLQNISFDFDMYTDKLLLLNTTAKENQSFYGKAIGKATLGLHGAQNNMKMVITGEVNDTTHIFIPTSNSRASTNADYIVFKQYGTEMKPQVNNTDTKLDIDLDLIANNQAEIDVILDELTGDVIKATGNGRLQIKIPANGSMTMNGRYNIERGRYDFNFQSFIRKPFDLLPDAGSYIEWNGDPYKANIHIDAQYTASRVSLNDLISSQANNLLSGSIRGYRGDVYVIAELRGQLEKPDIHFRLDFPANSSVKNDHDFALFLNRLQSDDNEMLKQVTYLIVFGSFAPYGQATTNTNVTSIGLNTISQKLTAELNKLLSNVLYKLTGDKSLQFDIGTSTYSSSTLLYNGVGTNSTNRLDRQSVNLKVNQSLLDGKIIITFGGDLDFNLSSAAAQSGTFQWLPDISIQVVLSRDRKLRAVIFNKSSLDVNTSSSGSAIGRRTRQGVSITYTKDFEKLFGEKPKPLPQISSVSDSTKLSGN